MTVLDTDKVDITSAAYREMEDRWDLIHDLLGGTKAMREAGEKWLPKEPKEPMTSWELRRDRSVLYEAYSDTVKDISSKPFSKSATIQGELPEPLSQIAADVNRQGQSLTQFAGEVFEAAVNYGLTHILTDYPRLNKELNLAEERQSGVRPKFIHVKPTQIIGWRTEKGADGQVRLVQIRIKETQQEPVGRFGEQTVDYIRVYTPDTWELWRKTADDEDYILFDEGIHTFGEIPLVTLYLNQTGFMIAEPTMEALAWMNLAHWQSDSDQRNILRFARVGVIFVSGLTEEEMDRDLVIGPNRYVTSVNPDARMGYVEHTGQAIGAGRQDLQDLEARMEVLGLQPYMRRPGNQTATGQAIDESRSSSSVQAWIRSEEQVIVAAYEMAAKWLNLKLPKDFTVDIFNDFGISIRDGQDVNSLLQIRLGGQMSHETFLREVKRRGVLSETVDIDVEMAKVEEEGPALGEIGNDEDE
ncbi:MAG: DUF4055 domain-containing protein [Candidatus Peribacteraceae bacterium]|nr:DUF4055 domain-containing protein [Candidatus Peribacteraceae bacterium]